MQPSKDELKIMCNLVLRLTKLRQNECVHLCIENFAPECFGKLLLYFRKNSEGGINA